MDAEQISKIEQSISQISDSSTQNAVREALSLALNISFPETAMKLGAVYKLKDSKDVFWVVKDSLSGHKLYLALLEGTGAPGLVGYVDHPRHFQTCTKLADSLEEYYSKPKGPQEL